MKKITTKKYPVRYVAFDNEGEIIENLDGDVEKCCFYDKTKQGRYEGTIYTEVAYHIGKQKYIVSYYVEYPNITREYKSGDKIFKDYESAYNYMLEMIQKCYDFWKLKPIYDIYDSEGEEVESTGDIRIKNNTIITEEGKEFDGRKFRFKCCLADMRNYE